MREGGGGGAWREDERKISQFPERARPFMLRGPANCSLREAKGWTQGGEHFGLVGMPAGSKTVGKYSRDGQETSKGGKKKKAERRQPPGTKPALMTQLHVQRKGEGRER